MLRVAFIASVKRLPHRKLFLLFASALEVNFDGLRHRELFSPTVALRRTLDWSDSYLRPGELSRPVNIICSGQHLLRELGSCLTGFAIWPEMNIEK